MSRLSIIVHYFAMQKGMTMKEVADEIGIKPATLSQNLAKDTPSAKTFRNLGKGLHMPPEVLENIYNDDDMYNKIASRQVIRYEPSSGTYDYVDDAYGSNGDDEGSLSIKSDMAVIDMNTGDKDAESKGNNLLTKTPLNYMPLSEPNHIFAIINFKGTKLKAKSLQDIKDIANVLSVLETMHDKEHYDSTLSLLVKQYGGNW